MGLRKGWLQEVDDYISTLEEDINRMSKENSQLYNRIWTLRKALQDIRDVKFDYDGGKVYQIATEALADDD